MPYVRRNADGVITSVSIEEGDQGNEFVADGDSELLNFLSETLDENNPLRFLISSDLDLTRVLEDLIDLLVSRGVVNFTDFPDPAQEKLLQRRKARTRLQRDGGETLLVQDEDILRL